MSLYIDLTEFLANPMKTGIQRISGEICKYLPAEAAIPVRLSAGRYLALPPALIARIAGYFQDASGSGAAEIGKLGAVGNGSPIQALKGDTVLVPEIFDEQRAAFFRSIPERDFSRYRFIVYDLLPFTHPEYFLPEMPIIMSGYFQVIRRASCCGFISEYSRDNYYKRLKRTDLSGGVVLPLGADSFGARPDRLPFNRPLTFTVLGTIEPRKNHRLILDAFEPLLRQIDGLRLCFIGKLGCIDSELAQRVMVLAAGKASVFQFHPATDDETIRNHVQQSRATIYVSDAEGYGLPPVESLWLGTPVIASTTIPSLQDLRPLGVHYVEPLNVVNLRRAVVAFLDDDYANRKVQDTLSITLPTWRSFTQEVLRWCAPDAFPSNRGFAEDSYRA